MLSIYESQTPQNAQNPGKKTTKTGETSEKTHPLPVESDSLPICLPKVLRKIRGRFNVLHQEPPSAAEGAKAGEGKRGSGGFWPRLGVFVYRGRGPFGPRWAVFVCSFFGGK